MNRRVRQIRAVNDANACVIISALDYDKLLGITRNPKRRKDWKQFRRGAWHRASKPTREWRVDRSGFFYFGVPPGPVVWMHREITGVAPGKFVGFRDGKENNLRRSNLVVCATKEQARAIRAAALARVPAVTLG